MSTRMLDFVNPATGDKFGEVPMATTEEVVLAHKQMRQAYGTWSRIPVRERVRILKKLQKTIIHYLDDITEVISQDTGKSRQDALIEVMMTVDKLHMYLKKAPDWLGRKRVPPGLYFFKRYSTEPRPFGVVGVIGPWNLPFDLGMPPIFSALLAGNTVLYKPSEVAGSTGVMIEKLLQSVPEIAPYVRVLHGDGAVGAALVETAPDLIFLTGSVATGRKVAEAAARNMIPFLCELGGKDPMIVLEDADIKAAAKWGVWGAFYMTGQTCMSVERVYVVESVYDEFVAAVLEETRQLEVGYSPDLDSPYDLGPLTFERQQHIVTDHLQDAVAKGARVLCGGQMEGLFMQPTVLVDVDHSMKVVREETFGPLMPIMKVKDEAEAIHKANDSEYGLSACVWSSNLRRAQQVAEQLEVGSVNVNDAISHYPVSLLPFGGIKKSGTARTHGSREVLQFTQSHSYAVGQPPLPFDIATQMREPGHYRLGEAVMKLMFGVGPAQKLEPLLNAAQTMEMKPAVKKTTAGVVLATAAFALVFGLFRRK
ncbi:MAG: aldehyde dehydrogenase family protein [Anaerolineales bacterium]|nr:aldehyde dehydrogenase family protein [Anaerolineales bacterium]MCB8953020.1 aldehyde dehydrogenase family protein [Ardenticatenales bacterium]